MSAAAGHALADRVALITGAASGQGQAAALLFAGAGARIAVVDVDDAGAAATVAQVIAAGGEAIALHADVSERAAVDRMVAATVDRFGRLDVLYNNAAVQMSGRLVDCSDADWDRTIATNLSAIFWACRAAVPHLRASGRGSIINTASVLGLIGAEGYAAYGAAKAGLVALSRQLATELAPTVRVNVIAPGRFPSKMTQHIATDEAAMAEDTALIPMQRWGREEEMAALAISLASTAGAYMTGVIVPIDGGFSL